MLIVIH